jgi:hypothetical protein
MEAAVAVAEADSRRLLLCSSASPAQCGVAAPTHVEAAIPLKPTSRIFLVDPPFVTPNRERLRRQDPKTIQRRIMPLAAEFRIAQPLSGKLSGAIGHVLPTEDAERKHLLGRELRPKSIPLALPHRHRQHIFVARLHEIGDDDSTRLHCSADFTLSRQGCAQLFRARMLRGWVHSGFQVPRSRRIAANECQDMERLA